MNTNDSPHTAEEAYVYAREGKGPQEIAEEMAAYEIGQMVAFTRRLNYGKEWIEQGHCTDASWPATSTRSAAS